ncbi:MAG TPA: HlyD family efflux transporter periplasmic adaptor subunit [Gammaproteobacteria bacterium]|nr:HlyD family efflux transporter periplasmic adaptor subunit [Gammaproteobacteria bacterium]
MSLNRLLSLSILSLVIAACGSGEQPYAVGILEWDRIELPAEANEPIIEILAHEGDMLEAGQTILRLDTRRTQAQLDEAQAFHEQAAARLAELQRGPRMERIKEAQAQLRGSESELAQAEAEFERVTSLIEKQLAAAQVLDSARTQRDRARADRDASHAALQELLAGTTVEELKQAEAAQSQAEARVRGLKITLERLTVTAPRKGRLDSLPFELGERPQAGETLAVLLSGETPYARVYVAETWRARITQGTTATVRIDGIDNLFSGRVRMISRDAVFTPFYSLTERDRSRLSYLAEVELQDAAAQQLSSGIPLHVEFNPD